MANTICLSTDLQTFNLITSTNVLTALSLNGNGVKVSLSQGDVTASLATSVGSGTERRFNTNNWHGTTFFDGTTTTMEIIGITEMEIQRTSYSLSSKKTVNIRRDGDWLIVTG